MEISFLTINRRPRPNYLGETLASLSDSDWRDSRIPVNLIMGSHDTSHVPRECCGQVVPWDGESERIHVAFTRNYIRALRFHHEVDAVICEDDIRFGKNWLSRLRLAVQEMPFAKYVLSLYTAQNLALSALDRGVWYRSYVASKFYGSQGLYYPAAVRNEIADYLERHIADAPGDLLIGRWADKENCLYLTQGSIVQHIGKQSTGLGKFHAAWNFQP